MYRAFSFLFLAFLVSGCDRFAFEKEGDEGELVPGEAPGTFAATAGVVNQGGFEKMEGPAVMEISDKAGLVIELSSTLAFDDTTSVTLLLGQNVPKEGTYDFANMGQAGPRTGVAGFYRSVLTLGRTAASESGTLVVTSADRRHIKATFEMIVFVDEETGPATSVRRRFRVVGELHAEDG